MGFWFIFYGNLLMRSLEARGFRGEILNNVFTVDVRRSILTYLILTEYIFRTHYHSRKMQRLHFLAAIGRPLQKPILYFVNLFICSYCVLSPTGNPNYRAQHTHIVYNIYTTDSKQ